jgi:alkanesulfonate monooxygenase SsuD/methylene tetrahydromethanopterin reductase-like flavin-dependent oxidoreductase (luciferase family)
VAEIRRVWEGGHFDAARRAHALVTDAMVDRLTLAGDAATWVARLRELQAAGVRRFNILLLSADRLRMVQALTTVVLPELGARP